MHFDSVHSILFHKFWNIICGYCMFLFSFRNYVHNTVERMETNLTNSRFDARVVDDVLKLYAVEVGHAYILHQTFIHTLLQCLQGTQLEQENAFRSHLQYSRSSLFSHLGLRIEYSQVMSDLYTWKHWWLRECTVCQA